MFEWTMNLPESQYITAILAKSWELSDFVETLKYSFRQFYSEFKHAPSFNKNEDVTVILSNLPNMQLVNWVC